MRRSEREIKDRAVIDAIIRQCLVCRLGLSDGEEPYIVPLCFGYDGEALYVHSASDGRKIDILRKNSRV
jgi:nitroimidazol reductase NimA-like FMN-containing flavoprotein (pyridoxamine 5'-phosphate oxidase superfamily)